MSRVLVVRAAARTEIGDTAAWYEAREPGLGADFLEVLESTLSRVEEAPFEFAFVRVGEPFRRAVLERFPYVVFFEVLDDRVVVVAVAHERRQPRYWRTRRHRGS